MTQMSSLEWPGFAYSADWKQTYAASIDRKQTHATSIDRNSYRTDYIALAKLRAAQRTAAPT